MVTSLFKGPVFESCGSRYFVNKINNFGIKKIKNTSKQPFFLLFASETFSRKTACKKFWIYRGSPTNTVFTSTNSTSTIFSAIGMKFVLVEFVISKFVLVEFSLCTTQLVRI